MALLNVQWYSLHLGRVIVFWPISVHRACFSCCVLLELLFPFLAVFCVCPREILSELYSSAKEPCGSRLSISDVFSFNTEVNWNEAVCMYEDTEGLLIGCPHCQGHLPACCSGLVALALSPSAYLRKLWQRGRCVQ